MLSTATATAADKGTPAEYTVQQKSASAAVSGEEIFRREWLADDPRSHGGDGLGPVFNESSCVACHNQGGTGGGGPIGKNVQLVTFSILDLNRLKTRLSQHGARTKETTLEIEKQRHSLFNMLVKIHPAFRNSKTAVIHRFGIDERHASWQESFKNGSIVGFLRQVRNGKTEIFGGGGGLRGAIFEAPRGVPVTSSLVPAAALQPAINRHRVGSPLSLLETNSLPVVTRITTEIQRLKSQARSDLATATRISFATLQLSQRNTTALFGAGLIDAIPAEAIVANATRKHADFPRISERVHRLQNGRVGRFGWKAQESSLYDFTMTACAVEVGLHVPDHAQSPVPYKPDTKPAGLDLNRNEVNALVDYLKSLPAPVQRKSSHQDVAQRIDDGQRLFTAVGCAACHVKQLGKTDGLFSDLLLHDMGPDLGAVGSYGIPSTPSEDPGTPPLAKTDGKNAKPKQVAPTPQEWRTPPLWGVRDSAPYLHDGRAATLEQAIAFHGGEAADARLRFFMQTRENRMKIAAFLKSLVAPDAIASAR